MENVHVWYKLNGASPDKVQVRYDADVDDLRNAVKEKWGDRLPCAAPELKVFAVGADPTEVGPLEPYDPIPTATTGRSPLIVVAPQQQQQDDESARKRQKGFSALLQAGDFKAACPRTSRERKSIHRRRGRQSESVLRPGHSLERHLE